MKKSRVQGSWGGSTSDHNTKAKSTERKTETSAPIVDNSSTKAPVVLQEGLVYFPNTLSLETQKWLIRMCMEEGKASGQDGDGFYYIDEKKNGMLVLNQGNRGRVIRYPSILLCRFCSQVQTGR
jgi:hypothetical protein